MCILSELVGKYYTSSPSITKLAKATNKGASSNKSENQKVVANNENAENEVKEITDSGLATDKINTNEVEITTDDSEILTTELQWCYCKNADDYDYMIACTLQWFHYSCVNITFN